MGGEGRRGKSRNMNRGLMGMYNGLGIECGSIGGWGRGEQREKLGQL